MPVIRISDGTMRRLKTWAEPLEDTAESALSKALDAAERMRRASAGTPAEADTAKIRTSGKRHGSGSVGGLSRREFRKLLSRAVYEMGGSARTEDLYPAMEKLMTAVSLPGDQKNFSSGDKRWRNAIRRERFELVKEGCLRDDSPRGTWELSEKGTRLVEKTVAESFIEHLLAIPAVGDDADFNRNPSRPRAAGL